MKPTSTLFTCDVCRGTVSKIRVFVHNGNVSMKFCVPCHTAISTGYSELEVVMTKRDEIEHILSTAGLTYTEWDVNLLLGTAATESDFFKYNRQMGGGPALGGFQCEPNTRKDIIANYLSYRKQLTDAMEKVPGVPSPVSKITDEQFLASFAAQVLFCYMHYNRFKKIGNVHSIEDCAKAWKTKYNTAGGAGKESDFIAKYNKYVG